MAWRAGTFLYLILYQFVLPFAFSDEATVTHGKCAVPLMQIADKINYRQVGKTQLFSLIGLDKKLQNEADFAGRDLRVQKDIDINQFLG